MREYARGVDHPAYQRAETYPPGFVIWEGWKGQPDPIPLSANPWPRSASRYDRWPVGVSGWVAYPVARP